MPSSSLDVAETVRGAGGWVGGREEEQQKKWLNHSLLFLLHVTRILLRDPKLLGASELLSYNLEKTIETFKVFLETQIKDFSWKCLME